jgi:FAD/FMN-containing dehydrogenase
MGASFLREWERTEGRRDGGTEGRRYDEVNYNELAALKNKYDPTNLFPA